jgi:hypothetical protein
MDAYDRCTNLGKKILPLVLPSVVEAENFSDHPHMMLISTLHGKSAEFCLMLHYVLHLKVIALLVH